MRCRIDRLEKIEKEPVFVVNTGSLLRIDMNIHATLLDREQSSMRVKFAALWSLSNDTAGI